MKFGKNTVIILVVLATVLLGVVFFLIFSSQDDVVDNGEVEKSEVFFGEDVTDVEGNIYSTVHVGDQVWMAQNLRTTSNFGESWCYNNEDSYCERYGRHYNWLAAMNGEEESGSRGICPSGWRVPTDGDWYDLENFFATGRCDSSRLDWGCFPSGGLMKTENWGGSDENKFAVLPAGFVDLDGSSSLLMSYAYFWTSTKIGDSVWRRGFLNSQENVLRNTTNPEYGYSVRCIKN